MFSKTYLPCCHGQCTQSHGQKGSALNAVTQICAGALPSSLATSASATTLDVSSNQLTALPLEWSNGFPDATQSLFNSIFLQQNRIQVCAFPVQTFMLLS